MSRRFTTEQDPAEWCGVIAILFLTLVWWRLGIPSQIYFDEVHYVNAARKFNEGLRVNAEHPMVGKTIIAAAMRWLGDAPLYWRVPSAIAGGIGLFAFTRLVWFASGRRLAAILAGLLLATDFFWFIQSRIAMLDMIMACFAMMALWQLAAAHRMPWQGRWRLALCGILLGLALGTKWSVAPLLLLPPVWFVWTKLRSAGRGLLTARGGGPVEGISLVEAALWLGVVPLCVYWASFWPAFHWTPNPVDWRHPIAWHEFMVRLQDSVTRPHPYRSVWYQWVFDWRAIWYLYKEGDGAQRGVILIGNPFTMIAGLAALVWAVWARIKYRRSDALAFAVCYAVVLGMWPLSGKPIQFIYHYLLPSTFLMGALALALEALWRRTDRWRWLGPAAVVASLAVFAWFYPIISAAPLARGKPAFNDWMWLDSWR
ncbi:MAG: phospholipid carrier-dependent glycosyltransferase [Novosphingobium sp.]